ncbi:hypothetical protein GCM10018791_52850 [Streptomyces zaomyceticus]|nr:hypothetical protein GCM10018791_52850 [Streptomyces zaomyceticus]
MDTKNNACETEPDDDDHHREQHGRERRRHGSPIRTAKPLGLRHGAGWNAPPAPGFPVPTGAVVARETLACRC